ncbi:hypothetical protein P691DRAFT_574444 [Macrolepiota fuliginosa MF-IS2]|uniref:F-box domain-containing protein n=1 Tax=Macrolepiota fuliginosa MF-IS2 TaxID=1400762 RepID=A0A9P5X1Z1_9AGAR|nr:hypothetical protein P691DRAFT_574444 [Macrolepiota fuliginosa MF-IS2]
MSATTTCPCCHQPTAGGVTSHAAFPSNLVPQAEIELIHNEASRLQGSIDQIRGALAVVFRRLNTIQSATRALPPETLSHIFQYACARAEGDKLEDTEEEDSTTGGGPSHTEPSFILTLGSVSAQWRDVVQSTPQLWSVLNFKLKSTRLSNHISLINLSLINSGNIPLDITLDYSNLWGDSYRYNYDEEDEECDSIGLLDPSIDDALLENISRMDRLYLSRPPPKWITSIPQFSRLTDLSIELTDCEAVQDLCLVNCTSLRHITLIYFLGRIRLPPSPSITNVTLFRVPIDTALELLFHCQSLIHFDGPHLKFGSLEPSSQFSTPTTLQHLRTFKLDARRYNEWHDIIMQYLHLPALEELHWFRNDTPWPNPNLIKNFFHRLPSAFKTLSIDSAMPLSDYSLIDLFPNTLEVEHIALVQCNWGFISDVIKKLTVTGKNGPLVLFPKLRKFTIFGGFDSFFGTTYDKSQLAQELFGMVEKRLGSKDDRFCLDIDPFSVILWSDEVKSRLRLLKPKLELLVFGEQVSLFSE